MLAGSGAEGREGCVAEVRDAEVTIIGGGAVGCAVAFTLARAGYRDIQLIERGELAGATSGQVGIGVLRSGWLAWAASTSVLAVSPAASWAAVSRPGWPVAG